MSGGSKKQTVGYRYRMGLHMGLCHGPVDAVLEVRVGDRTAWKGNVTSSAQVTINAPKLFGGDEKEGGVQGALDIEMGEADQAPNDYLVSKIGAGRPAYRGILGLVYRGGLITSNNPYIKPWSVKVRRILQGWKGGSAWYPEKAQIALSSEAPPPMQDWLNANDPRNPANTHRYRYISSATWHDTLEEAIGDAVTNWGVTSARFTHLLGWSPNTIELNRAFGGNPSELDGLFLHFNQFTPTHPTLGYAASLSAPTLSAPTACGSMFNADVEPESGRFWWSGRFSDGSTDYTGQGMWRLADSPATLVPGELMVSNCTNYVGIPQAVLMNDALIEVERVTPVATDLVAMNPAHIVYQCLTDSEWGMGYDASILDLDTFEAAADTFHGEGMGLSLLWTRQETIENFVRLVLDHAGATVVEDRRTGKIKLTPIRGDYDIDDLPHFGDLQGNVISVQRLERGTVTDAINEITVSYTDGVTGKTGSITVQNLAAIQAAGRVISQARDYPGFPTIDLALRAAMRDLNAATSGLARTRMVVTREGYDLVPGDVIKLSWTPDGIAQMPLRVLDVDYGSLTDGRVQVDCAEDVFGLPLTVYVKPQTPGWTDPGGAPQGSPAVAVFEVPYRELLQTLGPADTAALADDVGYVATAAVRPGGFSLNYRLYTRTGTAAYADAADGDWCPSGVLSAALGPTGTSVVLTGLSDLDQVDVGEMAMLGEGPTAELVRVDAVNATTGALTLGRGCLDTVPRAWPAGTRFWAIDQAAAGATTEYVQGEAVDAKVLTLSGEGLLSELVAPGGTVTLASRQARPYPPGLLRFEDDVASGMAYPAKCIGELTVSWAHRDRLLQDDQLIDAEEASIGPEAGTTYTVRYYLDGVLEETETGITGTSATPYTLSGNGLARVEVEAVRDGLTSWQAAFAEFPYYAAPYDVRISDAGDTRIADSGDRRITE